MKDPKVEQWLDREGVSWHYEHDIALSTIDRKASLDNQARFEALNEDHIVDLAVAAEEMELPAMIAYRKQDGRLVIIDGNHRMEAYSRLNNKLVSDFYIIDIVHPWVIDRVTRTANVLNGAQLSREERISHALYLIRAENMDINSAAKCLMISKTTIQSVLSAEDVRGRLARLGFTDRLPIKSLTILYRVKQDKALLEAANLAKEAKLTADETRELATRIERAAVSEKAQEAAINEFRLKYQDKVALVKRGKISYKLTPKIRLSRALNTIHSIKKESVQPLENVMVRKIEKGVRDLEVLIETG